ncbi:hypothetical protein BKA67DRAFT_528486, partial [Truncatella angustata]
HSLNNSLAGTLGMTLNEIVIGFKPRSALDVIAKKKGTKVLSEALNYAKERYNKRHKPITFEVRDTRAGPFKVEKVIGQQAYKLNFPDAWKVHPIVSVAHLFKPL